MASSCCGTKKQKLNNYANTNGNTMASGSGYQSYNHHNHNGQNHRSQHNHRDRDREPQQNGGPGYDGSSTLVTTNGHHQTNGICSPMNGIKPIDQVAVPDMCFFCFEVLYCELNNIDGPSDPHFTNDP